jgi:hypothetical protein
VVAVLHLSKRQRGTLTPRKYLGSIRCVLYLLSIQFPSIGDIFVSNHPQRHIAIKIVAMSSIKTIALSKPS